MESVMVSTCPYVHLDSLLPVPDVCSGSSRFPFLELPSMSNIETAVAFLKEQVRTTHSKTCCHFAMIFSAEFRVGSI